MSEGYQIGLDAGAQTVIARMGDAPAMLQAVAEAMDAENHLTISHISSVRMKGNDWKSFPAEQHILGIRSNHLRQSLNPSDAAVSGSTVVSSIGTNVKYAGIHEFGGTINMPARRGKARLRTDKSGELLRQKGFPHLAVFGRRSHKRVREVEFEAAAYEIKMPARAPISSGIQDRAKEYGEAVSGAIVEWFNSIH